MQKRHNTRKIRNNITIFLHTQKHHLEDKCTAIRKEMPEAHNTTETVFMGEIIGNKYACCCLQKAIEVGYLSVAFENYGFLPFLN